VLKRTQRYATQLPWCKLNQIYCGTCGHRGTEIAYRKMFQSCESATLSEQENHHREGGES
jgi:hypothetical protein